jgi:4-hydroxy-tetrahydrodipicolinate synthase
MSSHPLTGVTVPLVTVLDQRGHPDAAGSGRLLQAMAAAGVHTLMLLGSNGEGALLPPELTKDYLAQVVAHWRELRPGGAVVVNVSAQGTHEMLRRAEAAIAANPDVVMTSPPAYFRHRPDEIEAHVRALAGLGRPFAIYNIPAYANPLPPDVLGALLDEPLLLGLKDSSGDREVFARFVAATAARDDVVVTQGDERALLDGLRGGAAGIVPGLGNLAPALSVRLFEAWRSGDDATAEAAQERLAELTGIHGIRRGVPTVKAILRDRGVIPSDRCAPPLAGVVADELAALRDFLAPFDAELVTA